MRIPLSLVIAASGLLATGAAAQVAVPPAPPAPPAMGGGMMRADANHDGVVTRAEMIAEADARFTAMDTNKDGKLTADERDAAREAMRAQWRGGEGQAPRAGGGMRGGNGGGGGDGVTTREESLQRAGNRFDRLDTNHDGKLDAAEMAAGRPMRGPRGGGDMPPPPPPASAN